MKKLVLIFAIALSNFINAQYDANEWGFILKQYIRTKESRKEFIEKFPKFAKTEIINSTMIYTNSVYDSIEISDSRIDVVLNNLPNFAKFKYKISYFAQYDEYHIAVAETITIKNRFTINSDQNVYRFEFSYILNGERTSDISQKYLILTATYN